MSDSVTATVTSGNITFLAGDQETLTNHFRNAIYLLGSSLASTDTFRLEVKATYEFIPPTSYK